MGIQEIKVGMLEMRGIRVRMLGCGKSGGNAGNRGWNAGNRKWESTYKSGNDQ